MNNEFGKWLEDFRKYAGFNPSIDIVYFHLQQNPHLLREDGESATKGSQPTPEQQDVNQWTELAEEVSSKLASCRNQEEELAALTEMAEKAYERGEEEGQMDSMVYAGIQQQLAEKDKEIDYQWEAFQKNELERDALKIALAEKDTIIENLRTDRNNYRNLYEELKDTSLIWQISARSERELNEKLRAENAKLRGQVTDLEMALRNI